MLNKYIASSCGLGAATLAAVAAFAGVGAANAAVIGVNFVGGSGGTPAGYTVTGTTGVVSQSGWNNETGSSGTGIAVTTSSGGAGGTITYTSNATYALNNFTPANATQQLLGGWLDNYGDSNTPPSAADSITVSNLPTSIAGSTGNTPYDVYIYLNDGIAGEGGTYTVNGVQEILVSNGSYSSFTAITPGALSSTHGNYYEFTGLTGSTLTITALATPVNGNTGGFYRAPLNGFQIVSVPEPASLGLTAIGALGLLLLKRRKASV